MLIGGVAGRRLVDHVDVESFTIDLEQHELVEVGVEAVGRGLDLRLVRRVDEPLLGQRPTSGRPLVDTGDLRRRPLTRQGRVEQSVGAGDGHADRVRGLSIVGSISADATQDRTRDTRGERVPSAIDQLQPLRV